MPLEKDCSDAECSGHLMQRRRGQLSLSTEPWHSKFAETNSVIIAGPSNSRWTPSVCANLRFYSSRNTPFLRTSSSMPLPDARSSAEHPPSLSSATPCPDS
eukprot:TRINITY_DN13553_c0_g1_i1.p1 TRINITY_DN13553_c0_g1~~TRINITY_DN13553_c0_g1_i1.p1  ORF type:complete len:101 (-),score=10.20 TRINITY_DN13553_c0_g1_i1:16-318(-)